MPLVVWEDAAAMHGQLPNLDPGPTASWFVRAREHRARFADVYREYHQPVLRYFDRRTSDPEIAFDLMAETFAELFAHIAEFRGTTEEQGRAWMWTVARHQLYRWRERGVVERRSLERLGISLAALGPDEFERIEDLADLQRVRPQLADAFDRLCADQRTALTLRVVEHRGYDEIAQACGATEQVVRARVSRGLRELGKSLAANSGPSAPDPTTAPSTIGGRARARPT
jgi:RNA polymerase sigma factor (sigma-70 family)